MSSTKAAANLRSPVSTGKQSLLPPKCPFPAVSASCGDYGSIGSKAMPRLRDPQKHHQRTSSESFAMDEQPSWLEDLLNEPETPVKRGAHRRSSSDSFAYLDGSNIYTAIDSLAQEECGQRNIPALSPWVSHEFDPIVDANHMQYYTEANSFGRPQNRGWEFAAMNNASYPRSTSMAKDNIVQRGASFVSGDANAAISDVVELKEQQESNQDPKGLKEGSNSKQSEVDPKRAKQQFAQRSRVRKLQYIAELERNAQSLQAEGLEVAAELEFMDQQNLILNLENKTLKQRLDSLAQEQLIKRLQQEMLERQIARLRTLYQQQQQQQQQQQPQPHVTPNHGRSSSRDLDSQFSSLSLKYKDPNSGHDPVTGPVRI